MSLFPSATDDHGNLLVAYADTDQRDGFGRLRTVQPQQVFSGVHTFDGLPLLWHTDLTGAATSTHDPNTSSVKLALTTASGDKAIRQTRERFPYRAGQTTLTKNTAVCAAQQANLRQRFGLFDESDGLFLELNDAADVRIVRRSYTSGGVVDDVEERANWIDKLDGTGASGVTIDLTKGMLMPCDLQWQGVGRLRVGFDVGGKVVHVATFDGSALVVPTMRTASLPVRYEIENTGVTAGASELMAICTDVTREGTPGTMGFSNHAGRKFSPAAMTTTLQSIVSVRLKAAYIRAALAPLAVHVLNTDTEPLFWQLLLNPTVTLATWVANGTDRATEKDLTVATVTEDTGVLLGEGYVVGGGGGGSAPGAAGTDQIVSRIRAHADFALANADEIVLAAKLESGAGNAYGSIDFVEIY